jgi:hypothetical protein
MCLALTLRTEKEVWSLIRKEWRSFRETFLIKERSLIKVLGDLDNEYNPWAFNKDREFKPVEL